MDIDAWEILDIQLTKVRGSFDTLRFIRRALKACKNKLKVYVDVSP